MNLFVDTNVLLSFFHFSKDNLEELEKVLVLQTYGKVTIWTTDQVHDEFRRNREIKIADALKRFSDEKPNAGIPHIARGYPECDELIAALKNVTMAREALVKRIGKDIQEKSFTADKLAAHIFSKSTRIVMSCPASDETGVPNLAGV